MKTLILVWGLFAGALALPAVFKSFEGSQDTAKAPAAPCNITDCILPNCRCSSTDGPAGLTPANTPQIVILTFDDAVQVTNIDFYRDALTGRTNPNNCSISATFFVSHEYTNYALVHELHSLGHEIGLHSITHLSLTDYWREATVENLTREFADQKLTMTRFASLPASDIKGIRMPFLQMAGNNQFEMLSRNGFTYDLTRGTLQYMVPGLWPYTNKYSSIQDCIIGPCVTESYPNIWTIPMIHWENNANNQTCAMADACINYGTITAENTFEWMKREFEKQYNGNRAPVGIYLHAAWFLANPERFVAYNMFLDYIGTLNDTYVLSGSQTIDYMMSPKNITQMRNTECPKTYTPTCQARTCRLFNEENNERVMTNCAPECPAKYPWYGNPLGG